jgi:hypothetical protein
VAVTARFAALCGTSQNGRAAAAASRFASADDTG